MYALGIEMFVERIFERSRGVVWDDGLGAFFGRSFSDVIGIVSRIGDDKFGRGCFEESAGLRGVAFLAPVRTKPTGHPSPRTARWILVLRPPRERPMA